MLVIALLASVAHALPAPAEPVGIEVVDPVDRHDPDAVDLRAVPPGDHLRHMQRFGPTARPRPRPRSGTPLPPPTPGPDTIVYGYQAYWDDDLYAVPWDDISHIAIFAAEVSSTGTLSYTSRWDEVETALTLAEPYGVKVHLCVINFSTSSLETLLGSTTYTNTLLDELESWVETTGAHGVNVDFEGMPYSRKQQMVDFVADLDARVDEVVLATPAVDWSGAWDYDALTQHADLFIMGYGYHWSGSSESGPTDPLYSGAGTIWGGTHSLSWTVDDYLYYGADPSRVILGLPLYGYRYPVADNDVPTSNIGTGSSIFMADAIANAEVHGANYESTSVSNWYYDGSEQGWYPDTESVRERIRYVESTGIGGFGFWALHYDDDDPAFWDMIREETTTPTTGGTDPSDTGTPGTGGTGGGGAEGWIADAGRPFLAYVGDTVFLSGEGSVGPAGAELQYDWVQVSGPPVTLVNPGSATPSFSVQAPGTHVFELTVGDGSEWSAPARSHVVVLDPDAGRRHADGGCGCDSSGGAGWLAWLVVPALLRRRRR